MRIVINALSQDRLSWARTAALLLPLPAWVPAVATLIYPITAFTLILTRLFTTPSNDDTLHNRRWNTIFSIISQMQSVISTIAATVALAYLFPDRILSCNLEQQWQGFFHSKNSKAIRSIQDELRCCGLRSLHDRAWPFKDRNHGDNACELQLGYRRSCFAPWKEQQQKTSWMIFAAVIFVFAAKVSFLLHWDSWFDSWSSFTPYRSLSFSFLDNEKVGSGRNQVAGGLATRLYLTLKYRMRRRMRTMSTRGCRGHSYPSRTRKVRMTGGKTKIKETSAQLRRTNVLSARLLYILSFSRSLTFKFSFAYFCGRQK